MARETTKSRRANAKSPARDPRKARTNVDRNARRTGTASRTSKSRKAAERIAFEKTSLDRMQRWMLAVVTNKGTVEDGIASREARTALPVDLDRLEDVVLPSKRLSAADRLRVYSNAYFLRLLEILEGDFKYVRGVVGHERFHALVTDYLSVRPSRHYSLAHLGDGFSEFLAEDAPDLAHRAFLAELAHFEDAIEKVFDAANVAPVAPERWVDFPADAWDRARFSFVPALKVLAYDHPVNAWYQAARDGRPQRPPRRKKSWVALYRKNWMVFRLELDRAAHRILEELMEGKTLAKALASAARIPGVSMTRLRSELGPWFQTWTANGFFADVRH